MARAAHLYTPDSPYIAQCCSRSTLHPDVWCVYPDELSWYFIEQVSWLGISAVHLGYVLARHLGWCNLAGDEM